MPDFIMLARESLNYRMNVSNHYLQGHGGAIPDKIVLRAGHGSWTIDVTTRTAHLVRFSGDGWKAFIQATKLAVGDLILFKPRKCNDIEVRIYDRATCLLKSPVDEVYPRPTDHFYLELGYGYEEQTELPGGIHFSGNSGRNCEVCLESYRGDFLVNGKIGDERKSFFFGYQWRKFCQVHQIQASTLLIVKQLARFKYKIIAFERHNCSGRPVWVEKFKECCGTAGNTAPLRYQQKQPGLALRAQVIFEETRERFESGSHVHGKHKTKRQKIPTGSAYSREDVDGWVIQFEVQIREHHEKRRDYMTVPTKFMDLFDLRQKKRVILCSGEGRFEMEIGHYGDPRVKNSKHVVFRNGWWDFFSANKLKEGCRCVFSLNDHDEPVSSSCVMDVMIFRNDEEADNSKTV